MNEPSSSRERSDPPLPVGEWSGADDAGGEPSNPAQPPRPRPAYGELWRGPRGRRWIGRGLVALATGVPCVLLLGWRVGVTAMILAAIAHAVYHSRTLSSVPAWRSLRSAERMTEQQLRKVHTKGFHALHNRAIPDSEASIDHLIVGPTGVFAIDSERWRRELPIRSYLNKLYLGPFSQRERLDEAGWEAARASELIGKHLDKLDKLDKEVTVIPSLAVYGPTIPWKFLTVRGVDVFTGRRTRAWLRRRPRTMSQVEVERIVRAAEQALPAKNRPGIQ